MKAIKELIDKLNNEKILSDDEFKNILNNYTDEFLEYAFFTAREISKKTFSNKIYVRGLIEISNFCKKDCYYCGIRKSNSNVNRYRLTKEEILTCCKIGYGIGFRTFVMQGGEDNFFNDDVLCDIIKTIRQNYKDCAITLSVGERSKESYKRLKKSGANRFLLRHETADYEHYATLHPKINTLKERVECLHNLKEIGFQTGCGVMVGSPNQTVDCLIKDLQFIKELNPEMVGIGPFLPHSDTPFKSFKKGDLKLTLLMLSLVRIMLPSVLLPATTALGTVSENGREKGVLAGANVVMPNLSPKSVRSKYMLYNNKISTGVESAEGILELEKSMKDIGYEVSYNRGDYINYGG